MKSTDKILRNWEAGISTADQAYREGVADVQVSPMERAAAAEEKYLRNVTEASRSGRRAARLRAVTTDAWKAACRDYGADRLRASGKKGRGKLQRYLDANRAAIQALQDQVAAMPSLTEADMEARALAWQRGMREIRRQRQY